MKSVPNRFSVTHKILVVLAAILTSAAGAQAKNVDGCEDSPIDENSVLVASFEYSGTSGECLYVTGGSTLNFNGETITCVATGSNTCAPAVKCESSTGAGSIIQDTVASNTDPNVDGRFTDGILNCGTVKNLKIVGSLTGIKSSINGKDYFQNVIQPADGGTAIDVLLQENLDRIYDNRIDGGSVGIRIAGASSSTGPKIDHNVIRSFSTAGISNGDSSWFRLEDNSIMDGAASSRAFSVSSANASFTRNICEEDESAGAGRCACELDRLLPPVNCF